MNLDAALRLLEQRHNAVFSIHTLHPAFLECEALRLAPDQYLHHGEFCRATKMHGGQAVCVRNKDRSLAVARFGRPFHGTCPFGVWDYAFPVRPGAELIAVIYAGSFRITDQPAPSPEKIAALHRACSFLNDLILLEIALWRKTAGTGKQRPRDYYIRNYVGVFPTVKNPDGDGELDFQIQTKKEVPHAVNLVCINSPGLTSALPIARRVVQKVMEQETLMPDPEFNPIRKGIVRFAEKSKEEQAALIAQDPDYGEIFCRCECVTKAEIKQAAHNILGVSTVSGMKYRTRATMGRCQGGYCETRVTALLEEELGKEKTEILLNKKGAYMFVGDVK